LLPNRLRGLAMGLHFVHARADRFRGGRRAPEARGSESDGRIEATVAVDKFHVGVGEGADVALAVNAGGLEQHVLGLRAVGAGVRGRAFQATRPPVGAGTPKENSEAARARAPRLSRPALVERGRPRSHDVAADAGPPEGARAKTNPPPRHAAIAHNQVGAD